MGSGATTRRGLVLTLLLAAAGGMFARAAYLQVIHKDFLQDQGDDRYLRTVESVRLTGG
jgi:cell division protein FtsI (penicillin-binding protein 3)